MQTVIYASSVYGSEELGFETDVLFIAILTVQVVAIFGALLLGRLAGRYGAKKVVLGSLVIASATVRYVRGHDAMTRMTRLWMSRASPAPRFAASK